MRQLPDGSRRIAVILNLTPVPRSNYRIGLPAPGKWKEVLNSDAGIYGGSNVGNLGGVISEEHKCHGQPYSAALTLPPLGVVAFQEEV
jgi:1,4-alpha-glucan branching enzyme